MNEHSDPPDERKYQTAKRPYAFGSMDLVPGGFSIAAARVESQYPNAFRQAVYPDGSLVVQGMYAWSEGSQGGVIWKDLPLVCVDANGEEIK